VIGRGDSDGSWRDEGDDVFTVDVRFDGGPFSLLVSAAILVSGLSGKPALKGGERGRLIGDLDVLVFPDTPRPRPTGLSGAGINPASRMAFSSSALVGSLTGDFGRPGEELLSSSERLQKAAVFLTDTLDRSSS
jgi:hypothetical protein